MSPASTDGNESARTCLGLLEHLLAATRLLREELARCAKPLGLSDTHAMLLHHCRNASAPGVSQRELARVLGVSAAQVSGTVEHLRRAGLIKGCRPAEDRRRQVWQLTAAGEDALDNVMRDLAPWATGLLGSLSEDSPQPLTRSLQELIDAAGNASAAPDKPHLQASDPPAELERRGAA